MSRLAFGPALLVSALICYSCVSLGGPDPTASVRPTISAASASPQSIPSPTRQSESATPAQASPPPNPTFASDAAVARLLSGFATGLIPYHLRYESITTLFEDQISVDGSTLIADIDVSTPDFAGHFFDPVRRTDIVSLHGVIYTSDASGSWTRSSSDEDYFYLNPFDWMNEPDVRDLGSVFRIGRPLRHLSATWFLETSMFTDDDWLGPGMEWTGMHNVELDEQSFEAFVDDEGMPTEARLEYTLVGDGDSGADRLTFLYVWLFTHVGEEVTIEAPEQGQPI